MAQIGVGVINRQGELLIGCPWEPVETCDRQVVARSGRGRCASVEVPAVEEVCTQPVDGAMGLEIAQLAHRVALGDLQALEGLYDVAASRLGRYAHTLTHNSHDAEDALQACMIRIAENPGRVSAARHPWAYCLGILRNEALKIVTRRQPTRSSTQLSRTASLDDNSVVLDDWRRRVRESLDVLPPEQSEVVILKIWEGMTFLEIADVVGESINTVASRYRYALQKLSRTLRPLVESVS